MTYLILTHLNLLRLMPLRVRELSRVLTPVMRRTRLAASALLVGLAVHPSVAQACAVCVGDPNDPQTRGASSAILLLMGVTGAVLSSFVAFFGYLWWRARHPLKPAGSQSGRLQDLREREVRS